MLDRLGQLYWDELTRYIIARPEEDGRYDLPLLGTGVDSSFLVVDDTPAGFVSVSDDGSVRRVEQMFVLGVHRRHGLGRALAHHCITRSPGRWTLQFPWINVVAQSFWRSTLAPYDPLERTKRQSLRFDWMVADESPMEADPR